MKKVFCVISLLILVFVNVVASDSVQKSGSKVINYFYPKFDPREFTAVETHSVFASAVAHWIDLFASELSEGSGGEYVLPLSYGKISGIGNKEIEAFIFIDEKAEVSVLLSTPLSHAQIHRFPWESSNGVIEIGAIDSREWGLISGILCFKEIPKKFFLKTEKEIQKSGSLTFITFFVKEVDVNGIIEEVAKELSKKDVLFEAIEYFK